MIIKRPFIWFFVIFLGGMGLYKHSPFLICFFLIFLIVGIILLNYYLIIIKAYKFQSFSFLFLLPVFFVLGYLLTKQAFLDNEMDIYFDEKVEADIVGEIKTIEDKEDYQLLLLKDCIITINSKDTNKQFKNISLKVYNNSPIISRIGNKVSLRGQVIKFQKARNPGQFDEYQYNKILKIDYKVYCDYIELVNEEYSFYHDFLHNTKKKVFNIYDKLLPKEKSGILSAMIIGDKNNLEQDIKELYQQHGISHILAISGLHVSLIGMSLYNILKKIGLKTNISVFLSISIIYSYGILTNFSVSTNRAVVMLLILLIAKVIGRTYDLLSAASLSALIILMQNPLEILSAGFLLSFGAILGIGLIYPTFSKLNKTENKIIKGLIDSLLISISIQIMTLPVLLFFFFEISTYSILLNIILLPFVSIIITFGIIAAALGVIYFPLARFFLGVVYYLFEFYENVLNIANHFPKNSLLIGRPKREIIITYYVVLILYILLNYWKKNKYSHALLPLLLILFIPSLNNNFELVFLDVGQGDSIFLETSNGSRCLFDGGSADVKEVGKYRIEPFLKSKGVKELDYVFISHFDKDHVNGIIELMDTANLKIKTLVLPYSYKNYSYDSEIFEDELFKECTRLATEKEIKILYMKEGDFIKSDEILIRCLHPVDRVSYSSKNENSMVLDVCYKEFNVLLTGDVEGKGEMLLYEALYDDKAEYDVLKVAHHGSNSSSSKDFLSLTKPKISLISCAENNSYGHPHEELLERLDDIGSEVFITYESGAVTIKTDGNGMIVEEFFIFF